MEKLKNNKGLTLIELLVSLAILSIFMVTVSFFISSATKNTKQTKKQVNVQQQAQEVYDNLYDAVLQSTSLIVETKEQVAAGTASGSASADASGEATVRKSDGFDAMLASHQNVAFVSPNAYNSILYAMQKYSGKLADYITDHQANVSVASVAKYKTNSLGKIYEYNNSTYTSQLSVDDFSTLPAGNQPYVSTAQYVASVAALSAGITEYSEFDDGEYVVSSISTGPLEYKKGTATSNTIVYDADSGKVYLNRILNEDYDSMKQSGHFIDKSTKDSALIADNCTAFTIQAKPSDGSVVLKMTLSDGGYSYTVGGTISLRNASVMK